MSQPLPNWSRWLAAAAGLLDASTGAGLVALPVFTLRAMGVGAPAAEALGYVRFVGVFVGGVGLSYLWALLRGGDARLKAVFEFTVLFRLGAGLFTLTAVLGGGWPAAWLTVTATDFLLAAVQTALLRRSRDG